VNVEVLALLEDCLLAVAPILLVWEWTRRLPSKQYPFSLILTTISCMWILLGLIWRDVMGPDYSNIHGYIAIANSATDVFCTIAALVFRSQRSPRTAFAAISLAFVWTVTLLIMYAV
jgi:CDP-diglyceride synthetase